MHRALRQDDLVQLGSQPHAQHRRACEMFKPANPRSLVHAIPNPYGQASTHAFATRHTCQDSHDNTRACYLRIACHKGYDNTRLLSTHRKANLIIREHLVIAARTRRYFAHDAHVNLRVRARSACIANVRIRSDVCCARFAHAHKGCCFVASVQKTVIKHSCYL